LQDEPAAALAADREAILVALADGTVDAIATDHRSHATHEKEVEFDRAAFGVTGLETALALAMTRLHREQKIRLTRIVELFTAGPARVFSLRDGGSLTRGNFADVTIFDPKKRWTFEAAKVTVDVAQHALRRLAVNGKGCRNNRRRKDDVRRGMKRLALLRRGQATAEAPVARRIHQPGTWMPVATSGESSPAGTDGTEPFGDDT